jgi:tripartite-type tricarboxylate transporter receptor subunit TctC
LSLFAAIGIAVQAADAAAQKFPARPLRMICPSPPGGAVDMLSRAVGQKLAASLGVPVIIDNRAGASAVIGSELLAKSPPDGHTLMMGYSTHATNPLFIKKLPYDTLKDFAGVAVVGYIPLLLVVHPAVPAASVSELIAARARSALASCRSRRAQLAAAPRCRRSCSGTWRPSTSFRCPTKATRRR